MSNLNNQFPAHFREFISQLNTAEVEYLLIGGYAMSIYGHIRATSDLDIYINATDINAEKVMRACIKYGIRSEDLDKSMFLVPKIIGIGEPPLRIKLLKQLDQIDFSYAFSRAISKKINDLEIKVISLDDLILLKKAAVTDRKAARDEEDLSFLEKLKKSSVESTILHYISGVNA